MVNKKLIFSVILLNIGSFLSSMDGKPEKGKEPAYKATLAAMQAKTAEIDRPVTIIVDEDGDIVQGAGPSGSVSRSATQSSSISSSSVAVPTPQRPGATRQASLLEMGLPVAGSDDEDTAPKPAALHIDVRDVTPITTIVHHPQAFFSPGIKDVILKLISDETKLIRAAWFRFTLWDVAQALTDKQKGGINVSVLLDHEALAKDFRAPAKLMKEGGVTLIKTAPKQKPHHNDSNGYENMHHKYVIFGGDGKSGPLVGIGSWNCTSQAENNNWESFVLLRDKPTIKKFAEQFCLIANQHSVPVTDADVSLVGSKDRDAKSNFTRRKNGIPDSAIA